MNPSAWRSKATLFDKAGLQDRVVATVTGDDLLPQLGAFLPTSIAQNLDNGRRWRVFDRVVSANAYLGAQPIAAALAQGAALVITGRVADASLTLAPAVHELGWDWNDWDRLAAGTVAGHRIECGAQATGGLWCNWQEAPAFGNVGYPIAELEANGTFRITKPPESGGRVNFETVSEQLLYEVGDPAAYLSPDVTADFTSVALLKLRRMWFRVKARGRPATGTYKVSIAYRDGLRQWHVGGRRRTHWSRPGARPM